MSICYYSVDKKIFTSKIRALEYKRTTGNEIYFYYHDDIYARIDWNTEPTNSLDYYYRNQAQRIRDNYDYVILCYSGGYDSTNILQTYINNKIKLDKIVVVGAFSQDSNSGVDENHNGELYYNAFPYLKQLGLESITQVCDYVELFKDPKNFSIYQMGDEWIDGLNGFYSPHNWFWKDIDKYVVPEKYKDKKVAIIFGKDKPELENGIFRFKDVRCTSYAYSGVQSNIERINFYWDPTYPEILVKQLHILKRLGGIADNVVYKLDAPLSFKSPKSRINTLSLRDMFLLNHKESSLFDFYKSGIKKISDRIGLNNLSIVYSRPYLIK